MVVSGKKCRANSTILSDYPVEFQLKGRFPLNISGTTFELLLAETEINQTEGGIK